MTERNRTGWKLLVRPNIRLFPTYIFIYFKTINFNEKIFSRVGARLGEYNTDTPTDCVTIGNKEKCAPDPINILVEEKIAHEQYNPYDTNQYHDIALLRLSRNVSYSGK